MPAAPWVYRTDVGDAFKAGASYFGVSDLEALAKETHKFESRYLDSMIGPYPQRRDLYVERSPLHHLERLATLTGLAAYSPSEPTSSHAGQARDAARTVLSDMRRATPATRRMLGWFRVDRFASEG